MTADDLRQDIEMKIVELIKQKIENSTMTEDRAQQVSQRVLELLVPGMTLEELYRAIPRLDDTCPELSPVIAPILHDYEQGVTKQVEENVRQLIRQGQYDAATKLAKKAVAQEVKLVWQGSAKAKPQ